MVLAFRKKRSKFHKANMLLFLSISVDVVWKFINTKVDSRRQSSNTQTCKLLGGNNTLLCNKSPFSMFYEENSGNLFINLLKTLIETISQWGVFRNRVFVTNKFRINFSCFLKLQQDLINNLTANWKNGPKHPKFIRNRITMLCLMVPLNRLYLYRHWF